MRYCKVISEPINGKILLVFVRFKKKEGKRSIFQENLRRESVLKLNVYP